METAHMEVEFANRDDPQSMSQFGALDNPSNVASTSAFGNTQQSSFGNMQQQNPAGNILGNTQLAGQTSVFGNAQQNQPTNSLFGNTNPGPMTGNSLLAGTNTNNATQSSGMNVDMGSTDNTQINPAGFVPILPSNMNQSSATGANIFGNAQNQSASTSPFGNTTTTNAQPNTGLLGNTNTLQSATGGNLFGNATMNQPATGNTSNTIPQAAAGGNVFGNPSTMSTQPPGSSSTTNQQTNSLFGNAPATNQPANGLFGNTSTTSQPTASNAAQSISLFGNTGTTQQQQPLFGDKPGNLFGSTNTGTTSGTGFFPSTQQPQQPNQLSLFGSANVTQPGSLFGNTQNNVTGNGLFGDRSEGTLFGNTARSNNPFNTSTLSSSFLGTKTPAQQQAIAQAQAVQLQQKIEAIYNAWNPNSPQCKFQYYFYNLVNPNQVNLYGRPTNATNDALWEKALRENPDPTCHVPVLAVGFDDLRTRVEAQNKKSEQHRQLLKDIKSRTESLATQHTNSNSPRFLRAIAAQTQSSQKLSKIVQNIYRLIPSVRSSPISPEEERLGAALEEIEDELKKGRMKGKINELWAHLSTIQGCVGTEIGEWAVVDEDGFAQLTKILSEQQSGLSHLTKILQKILKDVDIILGTKRQSAQSGHEVVNNFSSTNSLRASSLR